MAEKQYYVMQQDAEDTASLQQVKKRYDAMKKWRAKRETKWKEVDEKRENEIKKIADSNGNVKANPKIPFEQILIETYLGMTERGIPVKMAPEWRVDWWLLEVGKYVFEHFLEKELSIEEIRTYRQRKARYGTGLLFSWVRCETKSMPTADSTTWFDSSKKRELKKLRHIGVKSIDIRSCYFDERAKKIEDAVDCIMVENIAQEEFEAKYVVTSEDGIRSSIEGIKNAEFVEVTVPLSSEHTNGDSAMNYSRNITLRHYWNQVTGQYIIIASWTITLYNWYMQELHTMLPLTPVQHYPDSENLYWIWIPQRFEAVKPYINSFLKVTLDSAWRDAGDALILMDNTELSWDLYVTPWETSIREFSGDKDQLVPYRTQSNIQQNVAILQLMDDYWIVCTGLNVKWTYSSPANTAFEAWIMKEEQNNRLKSIVTNDQIGLDRAFTMMRSNIIQFAPYLLSDYLYDDTTEEFTGNLYEIRIDGKKMETVKKKDKRDKDYTSYELTDDEWEYSMFEVSKENMPLFKWLKLKIETPTTLNITKTIEKEQFPTMLQSLLQIQQMFPNANIWDGDDVVRKFMMTYDVDTTNYSQKSKKDKLKEKQNAMIDSISSFNTWYEDTEQQGVQQTPEWSPALAWWAWESKSAIGKSLSNSIDSSTVQQTV
jgi:hypothetical protein